MYSSLDAYASERYQRTRCSAFDVGVSARLSVRLGQSDVWREPLPHARTDQIRSVPVSHCTTMRQCFRRQQRSLRDLMSADGTRSRRAAGSSWSRLTASFQCVCSIARERLAHHALRFEAFTRLPTGGLSPVSDATTRPFRAQVRTTDLGGGSSLLSRRTSPTRRYRIQAARYPRAVTRPSAPSVCPPSARSSSGERRRWPSELPLP